MESEGEGERYLSKTSPYHEKYEVGKPTEDKSSNYDSKLSGGFLLSGQDVTFVFSSVLCPRSAPDLGQPGLQTGSAELERVRVIYPIVRPAPGISLISLRLKQGIGII